MTRSRSPYAAVFWLFAVAALPLIAAQQQTTQFRTETNVVVIDVSALDRNRRPVSGLTAADFTILERGVARPLVTFAPVKVEQPVAVAPGWMRDVPADVQTNDVRDGRLMVLVIDERTAGDPAYVRKIAHAILDEMGPSDLAAVAYVVRTRSAQDFTNDRAKLRIAVDRSDWTQPAGGMVRSSRTLRNVLDQLSKVPDRRKTIYFISGGLNLDFSLIAPNLDWRTASFGQGEMRYELGQLQDILRLAQRSNVNIHTIDPNGLTTGDASARNKMDYLMTLADETGGRAIVLNNEPQEQVPQLFVQDGSYYLLGFAPAEPLDGKFRRLEVKVNREDVEVRARSGYYVIPTLFHRGGAAAAPPKEGGNLAGTIPNPELQMRLTATPARPANGKTAVVFSLGLEIPAPGVAPTETVDVEIAVFDDYGRVQGTTTPRLELKVPPQMAQAVPYHLLGRIDLKPGRYNVRAFARAKERDKRGTLFTDVIVPDMSRDTLTMSGLVLQRMPAPIAEPKSVLEKLIPLVPATARDFARGDQVDVWFRVVQGDNKALRPVDVRIKIQDQNSTPVVERTMMLEEMTFRSSRSSDSRSQLPVSNLRPGPYLLSIEASAGDAAKVTQTAKFTMR